VEPDNDIRESANQAFSRGNTSPQRRVARRDEHGFGFDNFV